jgi:hypothetical protein
MSHLSAGLVGVLEVESFSSPSPEGVIPQLSAGKILLRAEAAHLSTWHPPASARRRPGGQVARGTSWPGCPCHRTLHKAPFSSHLCVSAPLRYIPLAFFPRARPYTPESEGLPEGKNNA